MPEWRYPTLLMIRMLVLVPIMVVVRDGSDEITSPCSDQVMVRGSSPFVTEQVTWAKLPSSTISNGKLN